MTLNATVAEIALHLLLSFSATTTLSQALQMQVLTVSAQTIATIVLPVDSRRAAAQDNSVVIGVSVGVGSFVLLLVAWLWREKRLRDTLTPHELSRRARDRQERRQEQWDTIKSCSDGVRTRISRSLSERFSGSLPLDEIRKRSEDMRSCSEGVCTSMTDMSSNLTRTLTSPLGRAKTGLVGAMAGRRSRVNPYEDDNVSEPEQDGWRDMCTHDSSAFAPAPADSTGLGDGTGTSAEATAPSALPGPSGTSDEDEASASGAPSTWLARQAATFGKRSKTAVLQQRAIAGFKGPPVKVPKGTRRFRFVVQQAARVPPQMPHGMEPKWHSLMAKRALGWLKMRAMRGAPVHPGEPAGTTNEVSLRGTALAPAPASELVPGATTATGGSTPKAELAPCTRRTSWTLGTVSPRATQASNSSAQAECVHMRRASTPCTLDTRADGGATKRRRRRVQSMCQGASCVEPKRSGSLDSDAQEGKTDVPIDNLTEAQAVPRATAPAPAAERKKGCKVTPLPVHRTPPLRPPKPSRVPSPAASHADSPRPTQPVHRPAPTCRGSWVQEAREWPREWQWQDDD